MCIKLIRIFLVLLLITLSMGCQNKAGSAPKGGLTGNNLWVVPYHPCYQWPSVPADRVPWNKITHLIVGYLWPRQVAEQWTVEFPGEGCGTDFNAWRGSAQAYIQAGHRAGRKVMCMLGGEGSNPGHIWNRAAAANHVAAFAANITRLLQPMGFDGVDLDWEDNVEYPSLVRLAQALRSAWPQAIITIPTDAQGRDAADLAPAKDVVDAFMPMTYQCIEQWGGWHVPVPLTPLHSYGNNPYSVDYALNQWTVAGVSASKIVMGVGGFGAVWGDSNGDGRAPVAPYSNSDLNSGAEGESRCLASDNVVSWGWVRPIIANPKFTEAWDDIGKCAYWHAPAANDLVSAQLDGQSRRIGLIFYETPRSMGEKLIYCHTKGLKGMMFWTLAMMMDGASSPVLETIK
ncbi:MAG: glycosyl hydrolase family 18 protein [Desulfobacteraceae bacterium]|nr:glycosyl hydrolase family 18 protein [Desulfobacteraceae bacterium]